MMEPSIIESSNYARILFFLFTTVLQLRVERGSGNVLQTCNLICGTLGPYVVSWDVTRIVFVTVNRIG